MNVGLELKRANYFLKLKVSKKILIWSIPFFLCVIGYLMRFCIQSRFYHVQWICTCLWITIICAIGVLVNYELSQFQVNRLNGMKMLGLSNISILFIAIYNSKYTFLFVMAVFSVLNVFLVDAPLWVLVLLEYWIYWYIFFLIYFIRTWHFYRLKFGKVFYGLKKIIIGFIFLALFVLIIFQEQMQGILRVEKGIIALEYGGKWFEEMSLYYINIAFAIVFTVATTLIYLCYIRSHSLFVEDEKNQGVISRKTAVLDVLIRFRNKRWLQLIKLNYCLYSRNRNCSVSKFLLSTIWVLLIVYCKGLEIGIPIGFVVVTLLSALVLYRIRDDMCNQTIYESFGYTLKKMFIYHYMCGFIYLYDYILAGILIGAITGSIQAFELLFMICWMVYELIYFVSFNLYYLVIRKTSIHSQIFEKFECFIGTFIAVTPFSIVFPVLLALKVHQEEKEYKLVAYKGEEI